LFAKTPFLAWLGLEVERYEPDDVSTRLVFRTELSNDGSTYHRGVVGAVIDTTGALAAWSNHDFDRVVRASTVHGAAVRRRRLLERPPVSCVHRAACP